MKLKQIAKIRTGLSLNRKKGDIHDEAFFKYQSITLRAFSNIGILDYNQLDTFIATEQLNNEYITTQGDILVRLREPNYAVCIGKDNEGLVVSSLFAIIKANDSVDKAYLTHYINSNYAQKQLQKEIKGTTIPMIKAQDLNELEVILPPLEKQSKIVTMLNLAQQEVTLLEELKLLKITLKNELLDTIIKKEKRV